MVFVVWVYALPPYKKEGREGIAGSHNHNKD
jgi:hypothetical protein